MVVKPKFTEDQLRTELERRFELVQEAIISRLQFIGEQFVELARNNNTYKDHTGNLRSSIGYIILKDGQQLFDNFQKSAFIDPKLSPSNAKEVNQGVEKGGEIANSVAAEYPKGLVLIVVAGMEYAAYVESRGFDVLTGSAQIASSALKQGLEELQHKVELIK